MFHLLATMSNFLTQDHIYETNKIRTLIEYVNETCIGCPCINYGDNKRIIQRKNNINDNRLSLIKIQFESIVPQKIIDIKEEKPRYMKRTINDNRLSLIESPEPNNRELLENIMSISVIKKFEKKKEYAEKQENSSLGFMSALETEMETHSISLDLNMVSTVYGSWKATENLT